MNAHPMIRGLFDQFGTIRGALLTGIVVVALLVASATAQVITGDVLGTVSDSTGAIVSGATVTMTNVATSVTRTITTEANGEYTFNLVPPGQYSIAVKAQGFKTQTMTDVSVAAGVRSRLDVSLQVGTTGESVVVTSETPALQTDSSSVGSTIGETTVAEVPLNGRNITNLITLQPGVNSGMPTSITSGGRPDDRRQTSSVSANGQREYTNANLLDGIDNNERYYGLGGIKPSIDAIQEVRVETNSPQADIGRGGGASVSILTNSGTNKFHGEVYEFFRNDVLNARDYFTQPGGQKSEWRQNQYGGSISGPIIKDKTFFFFDVEQLRLVEGLTSPEQLVPSAGEQQAAAAMPDSIAKTIFQLYPLPNVAGTDYYISDPALTQNVTSLDARVDEHFSQNDSLFVRYSWNPTNSYYPPFFPAKDGVQPAGAGFISNGFFPGSNKTTTQGGQVNYTHIFTPALLMDLRVGFMRLNINSKTINQGLDASTKIGIPNANLANQPGSSGLTGFHFLDGHADLGDQIAYPIQNINNTFQGNGDIIYNRGQHSFKFGAALIRRQLNYTQQFAPTGWFFFVSPEAMLFGNVPSVFVNRQNQYTPEYLRSWEPSVYAKDDWRIKPWLTLNLGLRWDVYTPFVDTNNQLTNFLLSNLMLVTGGTGHVSTDYTNFAPRIGFAAQPRQGMVVHGAFGLIYYPGDYANAITLFNPPYNTPFSCSPITGSCPNGSGFLQTGPPVAPPYVDPNVIYTAAGAGISLEAKQPNWRASYLEQFNLTVQQQFGRNALSLGYVGSLGRRQSASGGADQNLPYPDASGTYQIVDGAVPHYYAAQLPGISDITLYANEYTASYNALEATLERQYAHGLAFNLNYTWARGLNNWSGFESGGGPQQWRGNPAYDYGNSDLDVRDRVGLTLVWELPWGKNFSSVKSAFLSNWSISSGGYWQTGLPFTVVDSNKPAGAFGDTQDSIKVNVVPGQPLRTPNPSVASWLNPAAYTPAYNPAVNTTSFTLGNERTNQVYGPNQQEFDLSAYKTFKLTESVNLQFRAEGYNVPNTPRFAQPQNDLNSPTNFGKILSTAYGSVPRVFQFALKMSF